jgi:Skp family chaperone for outer membrane proteins
MTMKIRAMIAVASMVPGMFLMQASGGTSVAVVDFQRAIAETPEGKSAITKLTTFETEQRTAIGQKIKEADDLEAQIRAQNGVLSEAARNQKAQDLDAARANIQTMGQDAQDKFGKMQEQLLGPVQVKTATAVRNYASEHGLKIVLDASVLQDGLFYVHDTADITSEIIRRIASDLNKSENQNAALIETPQEKILHRTWSGVNFAHPAASPVPLFPVLSPIKLARNTN